MYWLATLVFVLMVEVIPGYALRGRINVRWLIGSLFCLPVKDPGGLLYPVLSVGWTLNLEMFFYVLVAFALLMPRYANWIISSVLSGVFLLALVKVPVPSALSLYFDTVVIEFLFGIWIAKACNAGHRLTARLAVVIFSTSLLWLLVVPWFSVRWRFAQYGIASAMMVYSAVSLEYRFKALPRWLLFWGDASYTLYLLHIPVVQILAKLTGRFHVNQISVAMTFTIGIVLCAAAVVHMWIEAPLTRWLQGRFDRHPERSALNTFAGG